MSKKQREQELNYVGRTSRPERPKTRARFAGWCPRCGEFFPEGASISKYSTGWAHTACQPKAVDPVVVVRAQEKFPKTALFDALRERQLSEI